MNIASNLTLELSNQPFLLEKRIELLIAIQNTGSISKAAKEVPMSYKTAWEAVDSMNNLSQKPVVKKATGGSGGGGTTLTEYGENLVESYRQLQQEHQKFLKRLGELTNIDTGMLKEIGRLGMQISARNQIQCSIASLKSKRVNSEILLMLKSGKTLNSIITNTAVEALNLKVEDEVMAIFKSSSVNIVKEIGKGNALEGKVIYMNKGKRNVEIILEIGSEETVVAVMKLEELDLEVGDNAWAVIDERDIMVGR
jgi:molybdate transport system regulatory protein